MLPRTFLIEHWRALAFGFAMCLLSSFGQTFFISLFGGQIRAGLDLTDGEFGTIYTIATLASAAAIIWSGRLIDRFRLTNMATIVLAGLAASCALMGLAGSTLVLLVAIFGLRQFGQGLASHTGITSIARRFDKERGRSLSVASLGYIAGEAALPAIVVTTFLVFEWRNIWFASAAALVLAIPAVRWLIATESKPVDTAALPAGTLPLLATGMDHSVGEAVRDASFWFRLPAIMSTSMIGTGLIFHQVTVVAAKNWDLGLWAGAYVFLAGASFFSILSTGPLIDRFSARKLLPFYVIPIGLSCLVMGFGSAFWTVPVFMASLGLGFGFGQVLLGAIWAELYGIRHLGALRALGQSVMIFGSGIAPAVMGLALDIDITIEIIALASAAYCVIAGLFAALAPNPKRENAN